MNIELGVAYLRLGKAKALLAWGNATKDPWLKIAARREELLAQLEISLAKSRAAAAKPFKPRKRKNGAKP